MAQAKATVNKVQKRIDTIDIKSLNLVSFDADNKYPQRVIDIVNDSGTAKTCLRLFTQYVFGGGAKVTIFGKSKINKSGLTVNKLIRRAALSNGHFEGIAIHVNYNGMAKVTEVNFVPFEYCRLTSKESKYENMIAVHSDWDSRKSKKFEKKDIAYIHKFDPSSVIRQVEAEDGKTEAEKWASYKGQIYYWTPNGNNEYPLAPFDAVLEDMITEAQVKRFKSNTASKNFLASHILITGKEEDDVKDEDSLAGTLKEFQGGDGAGTILWMERENPEEEIELVKVDLQDYDGLFEYTENSSRDSIIKQFLIPPVLLVRTSGSLGTSKEIADASDYFSGVTADNRRIISEILKDIFSIFYIDINPSNDYDILPLKYSKPIDVTYEKFFSKNEIRESLGFQPETGDDQAEETPLAIQIGVGGTTALVGIIADPLLSPEQKKGSIMVLFGLSEDQTNQMLGL